MTDLRDVASAINNVKKEMQKDRQVRILKELFAYGQINKDEYVERLKKLF